MNARVSAKAQTKASKVLGVIAVAAAMLVGTSSVFAEGHGGGFGGGGHASAPHFGGGGHTAVGGHFSAAPHFSGGLHNYGPSLHAQVRGGGAYGFGRGAGYGLQVALPTAITAGAAAIGMGASGPVPITAGRTRCTWASCRRYTRPIGGAACRTTTLTMCITTGMPRTTTTWRWIPRRRSPRAIRMT